MTCIASGAVKRALVILGYVIGAYLVLRAIVELVLIDYGDASSYRDDWGGPSLAACSVYTYSPALPPPCW
jgi:hypothetical protein